MNRYKPRKGDVFIRGRQYRGTASEIGAITVLNVGSRNIKFRTDKNVYIEPIKLFIKMAKKTLLIGGELQRKQERKNRKGRK